MKKKKYVEQRKCQASQPITDSIALDSISKIAESILKFPSHKHVDYIDNL